MYFETIKKTGENYVPSMALAKDKEGKEFQPIAVLILYLIMLRLILRNSGSNQHQFC